MKQHYEKVITLCCFLFIFTNIGLPSTSFGVYQPYIVQIVGDTGGMVVLATRTLVALVSILFVDRFYHVLDCRAGIGIATLCTAAGFAVYSVAESMPAFLAAAALTGIGYGLGGMVGMTMLTRRWYADHIGGAVGFASVGSGVASIVVPLVAVRIIHSASLHAAFRFEAMVALAVGLTVMALLRNRPQDMGLAPHASPVARQGKPSTGKGEGAQSPNGGRPSDGPVAASVPDSIGMHLSNREYVLVIVAAVFIGLVCVGSPSYVTVFYTDAGIAPVTVAALFSLQGIALTVSKYASGKLFDAVGTGKGSAAMFAVIIVGLVLLFLVGLGATSIAPVATVLCGAGFTLGTVGISIWSLELADPRNLARSIKRFQVAYSLGGFLANTFPGPLKELTGSYLSSYAVFLTAAVLAGVVIVGVYYKYRSFQPGA